jgi:autotransporter strand-loop-strand O-heptosyltransferase
MKDKAYIPLFKSQYPHLTFYEDTALDDKWVDRNDIYAAYILAYRSDDNVCKLRTVDSRLISLGQVAEDTLGLVGHDNLYGPVHKPRVNIMAPNKRPMKDRYVAIGADAGGVFKRWNNPTGWADVAKHLNSRGYRVVCIDKFPIWPNGEWPSHIEDQTGNRPLTERARWLAHADLFIGLASGLSWLAWAVDTPVVMVSGFSLPHTEFENPFRVINTDVCHGCWNDMTIPPPTLYDHDWCPRHKGTEREYECSKLITSEQVIGMVDSALLIQRRLETIDHDIENGRDAEDVIADLRQRIKAN